MHVFIHMAMPSTLYMAMVSSADGSRRGRVSALIHVLGLRQAAAVRLGGPEGEGADDVTHVGAAILGGSGAIFWTTARTPISFRSIVWTWVCTVAATDAKELSFDGPLQIEGAIIVGYVNSTNRLLTVCWKGELIWALAGVERPPLLLGTKLCTFCSPPIDLSFNHGCWRRRSSHAICVLHYTAHQQSEEERSHSGDRHRIGLKVERVLRKPEEAEIC